MTSKELVFSLAKYKNLTPDETKEILLRTVRINPYINFKDKCKMISKIFNKTATIVEDKVYYNSSLLHYNFITTLLSTYTNIDVSELTYDELCKNRLLEIIISLFDYEYEICVGLLNNYLEDVENGHISI